MEINQKIEQTTKELLSKLKVSDDVEINVETKTENDDRKYIWVNIKGEDVSDIIGFHGKVLDSLQTILSLILEDDLRAEDAGLIVEVNNYREERAKYIENIAKRAIMEVKELKQDMQLTPMKSFERRIVHMVAKEEGLETESVGNGDERRVIIRYQDQN